MSLSDVPGGGVRPESDSNVRRVRQQRLLSRPCCPRTYGDLTQALRRLEQSRQRRSGTGTRLADFSNGRRATSVEFTVPAQVHADWFAEFLQTHQQVMRQLSEFAVPGGRPGAANRVNLRLQRFSPE